MALIAEVANDSQQPLELRRQLVVQLIKQPNLAAARQGAFQAVAAIGPYQQRQGLTTNSRRLLQRCNPKQRLEVESRKHYHTQSRRARADVRNAAQASVTSENVCRCEGRSRPQKHSKPLGSSPNRPPNLLACHRGHRSRSVELKSTIVPNNSDPAVSQAAEFAAGELRLDTNTKDKITIETLKYEDVVAQAERLRAMRNLGPNYS